MILIGITGRTHGVRFSRKPPIAAIATIASSPSRPSVDKDRSRPRSLKTQRDAAASADLTRRQPGQHRGVEALEEVAGPEAAATAASSSERMESVSTTLSSVGWRHWVSSQAWYEVDRDGEVANRGIRGHDDRNVRDRGPLVDLDGDDLRAGAERCVEARDVDLGPLDRPEHQGQRAAIAPGQSNLGRGLHQAADPLHRLGLVGPDVPAVDDVHDHGQSDLVARADDRLVERRGQGEHRLPEPRGSGHRIAEATQRVPEPIALRERSGRDSGEDGPGKGRDSPDHGQG